MIHKLKTWPLYFRRVWEGQKTFEIRINDRDYQIGDTLVLEEWDPEKMEYTGLNQPVKVTYILHGGQLGIKEGTVVMSIELLNQR